MKKFLLALLLIASPALAQTKPVKSARADPCAPIGKTAKGELVYSLKCDNLPAPPAPPPQAEAREPEPPPQPETRSTGIFGWSFDRRKPDE
jgi:hypothetical protein